MEGDCEVNQQPPGTYVQCDPAVNQTRHVSSAFCNLRAVSLDHVVDKLKPTNWKILTEITKDVQR